MVLIMTVNPGFGGQKYIKSMDKKIADLRKIIDNRNLDISIEVDGGIKLDNAKDVIDLGGRYFSSWFWDIWSRGCS